MLEANASNAPGLYPLSIGSARGVSATQLDAVYSARIVSGSLFDSIVKQHEGRCAGCGFESKKFLSLHPRDDKFSSNDPENFVPLCPFCFSSCNVFYAGRSGGGRIVRLPEVSQAYLNRSVRSLMVANRIGLPQAPEVASRIFRALHKRAYMVEQAWGSSLPEDFCIALSEVEDATYYDLKEKLYELRFIPTLKSPLLTEEYFDFLCSSAKKLDPNGTESASLMYSLLGPVYG